VYLDSVRLATRLWILNHAPLSHPGQFADPELRRFNLVAIDVPGHGATLGYIGDHYTPKDTAEDFKRVLVSLRLTIGILFRGLC
jgi:pimeloyl-ACP methyl ester carboxylesterase